MSPNMGHLLDTSLVVGSDGLIGHALLSYLTFGGQLAAGSSRRKPSRSHSQLLIDLAKPPSQWQLPAHVRTAYLCAGVASIEQCRLQPAATRAINCDATIALAQALAGRGARVIYLSSNQVFDGSKAGRLTTDQTCPTTEYGRQKADAEQAILQLGEQGMVVRLTKVLGPSSPMLQGWRDALDSGQAIHPFDDMRMAAVSVSLVVEALATLGKVKAEAVTTANRIAQISATRDVTYETAARHIAQRVGANETLIQPIHASSAGLKTEATPLHTTMDTSSLTRLTGLSAPDPLATIDEVLSLPSL